MKKAARLLKVGSIKQTFNDRHPFVVPVVTLFGLLILSGVGFFIFGGQVVRPGDSKIVQLFVDGKNQTVATRAQTVRDFLERTEVEFTREDIVEPSPESPITGDYFSINIYKARPVTVVDEKGKKVTAKTAEATPVLMAKKAGFEVYPEDNVEVVEPDVSLRQGVLGTQISIDRATPVKMNLYGTTYDVRTHSETVEDLMKERGISYDTQSVLPAVKTKLMDNDVVFVTQPGKQIVSAEETIPYAEETINDAGLPLGQTEIRAPGVPGRKAIVYEIAANGKRVPLQEVIISQPVTRVIVKGRKVTAPNRSVAADKVQLMSQAGIPSAQHSSADFIISKESGWRPAARSANNCIGLGQRCNASILISACPNWETDPVCQLRHFNQYAVGRYGSWDKAYQFWSVNRWW